ncbi:MAG TPA: transglutaminase-like cysteine peptidase [Methylophilaceae bacterium]|nr:transglutaminase-like cysteine peptidase [Methylophilaceae bacterium]
MFSRPLEADTDFNKLANLAKERYGENARNSILELQATVTALAQAPDQEKLKRINEFFNRKIRNFDDDINIWGKSDYWATPLESLGRQSGDCEDYSIAKYAFLRQLGISDDHLKLTYVRAQIGGPHSRIFQAHMVLSYYAAAGAEPLILDNLISEIRPASRRPDLTPIFSFNSAGLWVGAANAAKGDATSHLSRWRDVLARMQADGIE